ncbi:MAG TPA: hypothetical protein VF458_04870 [Ktedonobacteraceae bacterium]
MHGLHRFTDHEYGASKTSQFRVREGWRGVLMFCFLALVVFSLAACDDQASASAPTVIPSSPQAVLSTPPPVATVTFQLYSGSVFSLQYPQGWVTRSAGTVVSISDASGTYNLTVNLQPNANGKLSANQLAEANVASVKAVLTSPQSVTVSPTVTLAGATWSQRAVSGTTLSNGVQVEREVIILATNHPPHTAGTRGVVLIYMGVKQSFSQASSTYFAPMLRTFTFLG